MTSRVRDEFLIRYVTFGEKDREGSQDVLYKGEYIGVVGPDSIVRGKWSITFTNIVKTFSRYSSRHGAVEALLEAWLEEFQSA